MMLNCDSEETILYWIKKYRYYSLPSKFVLLPI